MTITDEQYAALDQARQTLWDEHHDDPNFTGCAIGMRSRAGQTTDEPVVIAMLTKKLRRGFVSQRRLIPTTLPADGRDWGVDVVQVGRIRRWSGASTSVQGIGVFNDKTSANIGTLGCYVRDKADQTINILGSQHVIGMLGLAKAGDVISQVKLGPDTEQVAKYKRGVTIDPSNVNLVDAAIAQLIDQSNYHTGVYDDEMPPINADHPAVGMVVAGDIGTNCFLARMDHALDALKVSLLAATTSEPCTHMPSVGDNLEKVGQGTGYSSSPVVAVAAQIKIDFGPSGSPDLRPMGDLIWTQAFAGAGDSGAVACLGGDGQTFATYPPSLMEGCAVLGAVGQFYSLPLTKDNDLTSKARDTFFSQSLVGQLLVSLVYQNSQLVIDRLSGKTANATSLAYAKSYYNRYHDLVATLLADPDSTATFTSDEYYDLLNIVLGLSGVQGMTAVLTGPESNAALTLLQNAVEPTIGMNRTQMIAYLNDMSVYQAVMAQLATLPEIESCGPVAAF